MFMRHADVLREKGESKPIPSQKDRYGGQFHFRELKPLSDRTRRVIRSHYYVKQDN